MTKGKFYFLSDEYCDKFSKHGVMANKETTSDGLHRRPCFYAIQDIKNESIYWMIPISFSKRMLLSTSFSVLYAGMTGVRTMICSFFPCSIKY